MASAQRCVTAMWQASPVYLAGRALGPDGVRLLQRVLSSGAFGVLPGLPKVLSSGRSLS